MGWGYYPPYVSVAQRRAKALREVQKLSRKGGKMLPVEVAGRVIAATFWGKAWCDNLESYSDFENRLPRGRTYVRNGSVVDLEIETGKVTALVCGSNLYRISINIRPLALARWKKIKAHCGGQIGSLVELLQGRLSRGVMEIVTGREFGLFPPPGEIDMSCSCPDWAEMCKHVAAVLYGIGARLDRQPELLFRLHEVDEKELIATAGDALPLAKRGPAAAKVLGGGEDLSELFGLDMAQSAAASTELSGKTAVKQKRAKTATMAKAQAPRSAHKTAAALPGKKGGSSKVAGKKH
jgi:uncharacterized Zn finger protein